MPVPVLALDVDGVIALEAPARVPVSDHRVSAWGRWRRDIQVPVVAADRIARLAEHFEIVWASAWGHNAHTALAPVLRLPAQPWTFLPVQFGKAPAVAHYAAGRPWLLVEEAGSDPAAGGGDDAHIIRVDPRCGIAALDSLDLVGHAQLAAPISG